MVQYRTSCATLPDLVDGILIFQQFRQLRIGLIETSKIIKPLRNMPLVKERVAAKERARRERRADIDRPLHSLGMFGTSKIYPSHFQVLKAKYDAVVWFYMDLKKN